MSFDQFRVLACKIRHLYDFGHIFIFKFEASLRMTNTC
jgi:hypothetical protein